MKYSRENIGEEQGGLLLVLVTPRTDAINLVNWTRSNSILLDGGDWRMLLGDLARNYIVKSPHSCLLSSLL